MNTVSENSSQGKRPST